MIHAKDVSSKMSRNMGIPPAVSRLASREKLISSMESMGVSSFVESLDEEIENVPRRRDFRFFLAGDTMHFQAGKDPYLIETGTRSCLGFTLSPKDGGDDHRIYIAAPPKLTWRNRILLFSVIEHEGLHVAIADVEGNKAADAFDDSWLGGKYPEFLLTRVDGSDGYDK